MIRALAACLALGALGASGALGAMGAEAHAAPRRTALVVGTSSYADPAWPRLPNAVHDADKLAEVLEQRFGYGVTRVLDGDRDAFKRALAGVARDAMEDDDLLIFVAGHGHFDETDRAGYLVLREADATCERGCYPLDHIKRALYETRARHVLVILDTCYAGTFDLGVAGSALGGAGTPMTLRGRLPAHQRELLREHAAARSRLVFTSVGRAPTLDGSAGLAHSPFMRVLLGELGRADASGVVSLERIVLAMKEGPEPLPVMSPTVFPAAFPHDPTGTFLFVPVADLCAELDQVRAAAGALPRADAPRADAGPAWGRVDKLAATLSGSTGCQRERHLTTGADLVRCRFGLVDEGQVEQSARALERRLALCEQARGLGVRVERACHQGDCAVSLTFGVDEEDR